MTVEPSKEILEKLIYERNNQDESIHSHCLDLFNKIKMKNRKKDKK